MHKCLKQGVGLKVSLVDPELLKVIKVDNTKDCSVDDVDASDFLIGHNYLDDNTFQ